MPTDEVRQKLTVAIVLQSVVGAGSAIVPVSQPEPAWWWWAFTALCLIGVGTSIYIWRQLPPRHRQEKEDT